MPWSLPAFAISAINRDMSSLRSPEAFVLFLLLLAEFFFGMGVVCVLPPFEGVDETAHYSRIEAQAFATPNVENITHISDSVFEYYHIGPMPYGWISFAPLHEKDVLKTYSTYHSFFSDPEKVTRFERSYMPNVGATAYKASPEFNWESQHPPLYYSVLGRVVKLIASHSSMMERLFVLRLINFFLAFFGFALGVIATWLYCRERRPLEMANSIAVWGAFYPFLMPEFFWNFARLSNDSLCLFFFGIIWASLLFLFHDPQGEGWLYVGIGLGLSLLTKSLMFPVVVGVLAFLAWHSWIRKTIKIPLLKIGLLVVALGLPAIVLAGGAQGLPGGGELYQFFRLQDPVGLFMQKVSADRIWGGLEQIFCFFVWATGTWSEIVINTGVVCFLYGVVFLILGAYLWNLRHEADPVFQLPLWAFLPLLAALMAHVGIAMLVGPTSTPGYYMHVLAPAFSLMVGTGLWRLERLPIMKWVIRGGFGIILIFNFLIVASYVTVFAGCNLPQFRSTLMLNTLFWLEPKDVFTCWKVSPEWLPNLTILSWPSVATVVFSISIIFLLYVVYFIKKYKVTAR